MINVFLSFIYSLDIFQCYNDLKYLYELREKAEKSFELTNNGSRIYLDSFSTLDEIWDRFEEKLLNIFKSLIRIAQSTPSIVVRAWQIVELEEENDRESLEAPSEGGKSEIVVSRNFKNKAITVIKDSIDAQFDMLLSKEVAEKPEEFISNCNSFLDDLTSVLDDVVPCLPDSFHFFNFYSF